MSFLFVIKNDIDYEKRREQQKSVCPLLEVGS